MKVKNTAREKMRRTSLEAANRRMINEALKGKKLRKPRNFQKLSIRSAREAEAFLKMPEYKGLKTLDEKISFLTDAMNYAANRKTLDFFAVQREHQIAMRKKRQ